ncbi:hypothetical protein [Rhizobium leguminosarum]|uniref:hypothetical protein n=1 Tax=Rhizobium leguminosarum TaxID=384 RepID=UPI00198098B1|nr:hypothetical protein [Rhizobium leguminosarum]
MLIAMRAPFGQKVPAFAEFAVALGSLSLVFATAGSAWDASAPVAATPTKLRRVSSSGVFMDMILSSQCLSTTGF